MNIQLTPEGLSDTDLERVKHALAENRNMDEVGAMAHALLDRLPPAQRRSVAAHLCEAHPFFLPTFPEAEQRALTLDAERHRRNMLSARVSAGAIAAPRVLIACPPKSASSFLVNALGIALENQHVSLSATSYTARASSSLGGNLREQEVDETALLRHCLDPRGFVAQHHVRGTPYLSWLLEAYGAQVIIPTRNLFDSLVSFDDMLCQGRGAQPAPGHFFSDAMPADYALLSLESRLELLMERWLFWYIQFYVSWRKTSQFCALKPIWISYERDVLAGNEHLARRFAAEIPALAGKEDSISMALDQVNGALARRNQGVAGRGAIVPPELRDRAMRLIKRFEGEADLSALLDEPPTLAVAGAA